MFFENFYFPYINLLFSLVFSCFFFFSKNEFLK